MTKHVQELIDKIKNEGVQAAETQAREIKEAATAEAKRIIDEARAHAAQIEHTAEEECQRKVAASRKALQHAARDTILNLRKEIEHLLRQLVSKKLTETVTPETLVKIIQEAVRVYLSQDAAVEQAQVTVSVADHQRLQKGMLAELQARIKKPLTLQSAQDIKAGFTISFDQGKSCFDFSDQSLVNYLSQFVNPELAALMKDGTAA